MTDAVARWSRPALGLVTTLALVLAWDFSGADRSLSAWLGGQAGFPLREATSWASQAHALGRSLSALALGLLLLDALWPHPPWAHRRTERSRSMMSRFSIAALTAATLVAVPGLKRLSASSCPWDVVDFGGQVPWVSHWVWTVTDGGPGHCFPSGHAVAAFAFYIPALAAPGRSRRAKAVTAAAVTAAGALFGTVQMLRGAHYLSHVLWSAWLCLAIAGAAAWRLDRPDLSLNAQPQRRIA